MARDKGPTDIYVRVRPETYQVIAGMAKREHRSMSAQTAYMLERLLADFEELPSFQKGAA